MKKINNKNIWCLLDILAIIIALSALICNLTPTKHECVNNTLCIIAGSIGFYYFATSVYIFFFNRPKFDWHLVNGNYLAKVVALVLLFPSIIASCFLLYNSCPKNSKYSPQNLVYDENLYSYNNAETDTLGIAKCELFTDSVFLNSHNLELSDSIIIQKNKLPKTIISKQEDPSIFWTVYYHFIDPGNQHMTTSQSGRGWSALIAILGVFLLNGLLVSSIIGWIDSRKEKWLKGKVKYPCFLRRKKHYLIIGGNDIVTGIVKQIISKKEYILIQTSNDVESFRRELFSNLTEEQQRLIIIYYGNRTAKEDIEKLHIENAEEIYIIGEEIRTDDIESYHDTMNIKCLKLLFNYYKITEEGIKITQLLNEKENINKNISESNDDRQKSALIERKRVIENELKTKKRLTCRVMFEYQTTFSVFQFCDLDKELSCFIKFKPFNYYEMWAQKVFINKEINEEKLKAIEYKGGYLPLEGYKGIKREDLDYVHLFIVGMSRMGIAMAIEGAHLAHYPNYTEENKIRTKITFIDKNAAEEKEFFIGRFKELFSLSHYRYGEVSANNDLMWHMPHIPSDVDYLGGDFIDIEWEFINGGIEQKAVQDYILETTNYNARITIAICLPESNRAHAASLYLHKKIFASDAVKQILVYNRYGDSIINALHSKEKRFPFLNKLKSFGAPDICFDAELLEQSEKIGNAVGNRYNEINKLYIEPAKLNVGQVDTEVKYKGKSQIANFFSNTYNGNMIWTKLRSIEYKGNGLMLFPKQISMLSDVEHNRWNIEQLLMNFRPLTIEEQEDVINKKKDKEVLKGEMAHLDICSNKRLLELNFVDVAARAYDEGLTALLPDIYSQLSNNND